ncbi:MAG TPA: PAS domain S-box protein, partial [Spirochaetes bacterium]|nr:PAS domain S-box protein [Spirochaetota bacterium]
MEYEKYRVLLIEDSKIDQMAFIRYVEKDNLPYDYAIAASTKEATISLKTKAFDVIVMDYELRDGTSLQLFELIENTPVIVVTGSGNEEIAVNVMKSGAYDYIVKDPEYRYLKLLPVTVENAIGHARAKRDLRMLSRALMSISDSVYIVNMEDEIIFTNRAFCNTYGYQEDEISGKHSHILWTKEELAISQLDKMFSDNGSEFNHKRKDGSAFPVSLSKSTVIDAKGREIAFVGVAHDITERVTTQKALGEYAFELERLNTDLRKSEYHFQELNEAKDKFFSILSHDLKDPFNGLLGLSELLFSRMDRLEPEDIKESIKSIYESSKHLYQLLEKLLQWGQIQMSGMPFEPEDISLDAVTKDCIRLLKNRAEEKNIHISCEIPNGTRVFADQNMIHSILQNLITNGIKFTPKGGQIRVFSEDLDQWTEVFIKDTGVGISREDQEKLFQIDQYHSTTGT